MPALIFDYDGLMVDSERVLAETVVRVVAEMGATIEIADFGHLFGSTELDDEWDRMVKEWLGNDATGADLDARVWEIVPPLVEDLPLLPGVLDLLSGAQAARWRVGLGTGQGRAHLERRLRRLDVWDRFDVVVTAAEVARGKPSPDIFLAVASRLATPPAECVVLEDSLPGCEAALAAGMHVVVCPSIVTAGCDFPIDARRVSSLLEVEVATLIGGAAS